MRKTKLVITVGPALLDGGPLQEALKLADVVRINASHAKPETRESILQQIRSACRANERDLPIFLDLQGPKWRIGIMDKPEELVNGSIGVLYLDGTERPAGVPWAAPLPHPELFAGAKPGQVWSLDDGELLVEVVEVKSGQVFAKVTSGGLLKSRKGVHPIGIDVAIEPLTPKDMEDVAWGVEKGVDFFAQSFVRSAEDVQALADRIKACGGSQPIIAKIEHPAAIDNLEGILNLSWAVMVARGDLGVELGVERVPTVQKHIIRMARQALTPVITATQMLESMIEHASPTRAEASDVANAIWDGTDAVMLSAESAAGKHPLEAIQWLARIAEDADEHYKPRLGRLNDSIAESFSGGTEVSVSFAACRTAEDIKAKYIVVFTEGGSIVRMVSRLAASTPVIAATSDTGIARRMCLLRGVQSLLIWRTNHMSELEASVYPAIRTKFNVSPSDRMVVTFGHPLWITGGTNTMKVV